MDHKEHNPELIYQSETCDCQIRPKGRRKLKIQVFFIIFLYYYYNYFSALCVGRHLIFKNGSLNR